jgi:hypothetical protein
VAVAVDAGYDGLYSSAGPTPVRIKLTNAAESFRARVELDAPSETGRVLLFQEIDLPQNSSKVLTLFPRYGGLTTRAQVRVLDGDAVVGKGEDGLTRVEDNSALYGVLAPDTSAYAALAGRSNRGGAPGGAVALLRPESLPDRADALLPLASVIVDGMPTDTLSEAQLRALTAWVQLGGRLIIAGGADAAQNAAGLSPLMPVTLGARQNARDLSALSRLAGGQAPPAGGVIAQAVPAQGATVAAASPQGPLVVTRDAGRGSVSWLAWSPSAPPFRGWPGTIAILRNLSTPAESAPAADGFNFWESNLNSLLHNVAGAKLPPTALVAAFLLIYTLLIGPLLYLVLKRRDKRELAWVLVPAITLAFSGLAYGANFLIRGTGTTLRTLEVVDVYPGAEAQRVTAYASLFSPNRRSYDLQLSPGLSVRGATPGFDGPFGPGPNGGPPRDGGTTLTVQTGGDRSVLRDVRADVYSFRDFSAQGVAMGQPPAIETKLTGNGDRFSGQIRNLSGAELENVYFIDQAGVHSVGSVGPGQSRALDSGSPTLNDGWDGSGPPPDWGRQQFAQDMYRQLAGDGPEGPGRGMRPDEVVVLAWQKSATPPVSVLDARAQSTGDRVTVLHSSYALEAGAVDMELQPEAAPDLGGSDPVEITFRLPQGVTPERVSLVVRQPALGGKFSRPVFDDQGNIVGEEGFPMEQPAAPDAMLQGVSKIEIQDPATRRWIDITGKPPRNSASAEASNASRFVAQGGAITVRVTGAPSGPPEWLRLRVVGRKR